jgi:hypothetical protein
VNSADRISLRAANRLRLALPVACALLGAATGIALDQMISQAPVEAARDLIRGSANSRQRAAALALVHQHTAESIDLLLAAAREPGPFAAEAQASLDGLRRRLAR